MKVLFLSLILLPGLLLAQDGNRLLERGATGRARGQPGAPVMVYEIADFQCPYCARFAREVFPRIDSAFVKTGKVQWFYVNMPLPNHGNAWAAAEAAMCAGAVADKFWAVHDRLYATQAEWSGVRDIGAAVRRVARDAGVSGDAYEDCLVEDRMSPLLLQDVIFATSTRLTGTPAFIINNEQSVLGLKTWEEWRDLLEKALRKAK